MSDEIKYGSVDTIPIKQVVARTKRRLQLVGTDRDADVELFINEAGATLGAKPTFRLKNCRVEIDSSGRAKLPCGFKRLHGVRVEITDTTTQTTTNPIFPLNPCGDMLYLEKPFFEACGSNENIACKPLIGSIQIVGNQIVFPIPCPFTHATISFDGYATSESDGGILEMHPSYERGFSEYSRAMMLSTYPNLWNPEWGSRQAEIDLSFRIWATEYHALNSDAFSDSFQVNNYMVKRILGSLLMEQNNVFN
jgi:hypothetical protein